MSPRFFVQQTVISFSRCDMELLFADHIVKLVGIDARRIYYDICQYHPILRFQNITGFSSADLLHLPVEQKFHSVVTGVLRHRYGQSKRADYTSGGSIQCFYYLICHIGLYFPNLVSGNNFQARHPVFLSFVVKIFQS